MNNMMDRMKSMLEEMIEMENELLKSKEEDLKEISKRQADIEAIGLETKARAIKDGLTKDTIHCKYCGEIIDNDSIYCKICGKKLTK